MFTSHCQELFLSRFLRFHGLPLLCLAAFSGTFRTTASFAVTAAEAEVDYDSKGEDSKNGADDDDGSGMASFIEIVISAVARVCFLSVLTLLFVSKIIAGEVHFSESRALLVLEKRGVKNT